MNAFEEVRFMWADREWRITPDRMLACIAKIEDVITLGELNEYLSSRRIPFGKLAMAFAAVLRHAGVPNVNDYEVYRSMFAVAVDEDGKPIQLTEDIKHQIALDVIEKLMVMMLPPDYIEKKLQEANTGKKQ
jgi:hypothetical protein